MLTSSQLAIAISAVLASALLTGWILHWLWARAVDPARGAAGRLAEMAKNLHLSDQARHQAEEARVMAETELANRTEQMQAEMEAMQVRLDGAIEGREAELTRELQDARHDAETAMNGLRNARQRIADLEAQLSQTQD